MIYATDTLSNWVPDFPDLPDERLYQYASVDETTGELLGYIGYYIDWYSNKAYGFGMMSFKRGSYKFAKDIYYKIEELVNQLHVVEWRMVGGNPVERSYDKFIKKHGGNKFVLRDRVKDKNGVYHDDVIYEIINNDRR